MGSAGAVADPDVATSSGWRCRCSGSTAAVRSSTWPTSIAWSSLHAQQPEHWYLSILGTDPAAQGRGIGASVLQPVLDRADADGVGAYLESSKESNIAFYRRFGFEVIGEHEFHVGGPTVWPMWRDPQPPRLDASPSACRPSGRRGLLALEGAGADRRVHLDLAQPHAGPG